MDIKKTYLNKDDLEYFRQKLLKERQKIVDYMENRTKDLQISSGILDEVDMASTEIMHSLSIRVVDRDEKLLKRIDYVLSKIDSKTYGVCEKCGGYIPKERLEIRPIALLCIKCKAEQEQKEKIKKRKKYIIFAFFVLSNISLLLSSFLSVEVELAYSRYHIHMLLFLFLVSLLFVSILVVFFL